MVLAAGPLALPDASQRCGKYSRRNDRPCNNWAVHGSTVCRMHGGSAPQVKAKAEQRIREAAEGPAITRIVYLIDHAEAEAIQLAAARDILDRAGFSAKQRQELSGDVTFTLRIDRGHAEE